MDKIYHYTGMIVFWGIILVGAICLVGIIWQQWLKYKFITWAYQVYEFIRFRKKIEIWKDEAKDWGYNHWEGMKIHRAKFDGKIKGQEYRKRNLFKRYYIRQFDELLNSEEHEKYKAKYPTEEF